MTKQKFVLHEHWATHHHFDLRLQHAGVLKSWAVPKGLPHIIGQKNLAIQVPDHPAAYAEFKGEIPKGEYGAGRVEIADHGYYTPVVWSPGEIKVILHGKKYKGKYVLVPFPQSRKKEWLIIKAK
jgi:bifunctional non-homologous end joining protein LigD